MAAVALAGCISAGMPGTSSHHATTATLRRASDGSKASTARIHRVNLLIDRGQPAASVDCLSCRGRSSAASAVRRALRSG